MAGPAGCAGTASPGCVRRVCASSRSRRHPSCHRCRRVDRPAVRCPVVSACHRSRARHCACRISAGCVAQRVSRWSSSLPTPRLRPLPALGPCRVAACSRRAESEHGYCSTHYVRWRTTVTTDPDADQRHWQLTQPAVSQGGEVSLRGLAPLVVVEVLFGVQQRVRGGAQIVEVPLRAVGNMLRREQATQIAACPAECVTAGKPARQLLTALVCHVRRALADPGHERAGDSWDLALFGHRGRLSFTGISQPWLAHAAKAWAGEQLPRHRGAGASNCLLYTSDAADDLLCVDLGGRRIIKKKKERTFKKINKK